MAVGALAVSASAVLIDLSGASPGTASFYRCLFALPVLAVLAVGERRRDGSRPARDLLPALAGGTLFAADMLLWTQAILEVGAGLSTVLVNAQIVIVPLLALIVDREPVRRRYLLCLPWLVVGVILAGGVLEHGVSAANPLLGTVHAVLAAACYSGFLYLLRRGGRRGGVIRSYTWVIAVAAVVSLIAGAAWHGVELAPGWTVAGWLALTAMCGQVAGWLLVARAAPRLRSDTGAALLMLTPVGALVLSAAVLGERPTLLQLLGSTLMLLSAYVASSDRTWHNPLRHRPRSDTTGQAFRGRHGPASDGPARPLTAPATTGCRSTPPPGATTEHRFRALIPRRGDDA
jgi:drug/metabolite transporter (DMT)-like permease